MGAINFREMIPAAVRPYVLHTRPRSWGIVVAHMSAGFLLATGLHLDLQRVGLWALAALAWAIFGNGGTLAINSAYDRDEGDIGYLENPPPVPHRLAPFAIVWMLIGFIPAGLLGWRFTLAYALSFIMSLIYSVPPFRFKARAGLDVLINSIGYGALTIYAGWAAAARPLEAPILNLSVAFFFFFVGFYPLTQIYQMGEDAQRGDHTLALAIGKTNSIRLGILGVTVGFVFLALEFLSHSQGLRSLLMLLPVAAWVVVLIPWYLRRGEVDIRFEQRRFYHALSAWALTDLVAVFVFGFQAGY